MEFSLVFVGVVLALIYRLMQNNRLGSGAQCFISVQDNGHVVFSVFALSLNILCGAPLIVLAQLEQSFETVHFSVYHLNPEHRTCFFPHCPYIS